MTDDSTDNDSDEQHRSRSSRRKFLGVALASPALLGLGVGSYEALSRSEDSYDTALVCELSGAQDDLVGNRTAVSADPRLLDATGLSVGQQLRLARSDDEFATYTVVEDRPEAPDDIVRMSDSGKFRLDLTGQVDDEADELNSCPDPRTEHSLPDEFEADVSATVPADDLSVEQARERGELVERLDERDSSLVTIAPHGGGMQPRTDEQAALVGDLVSATSWRALGWGPTPAAGAFRRWYVPSTELSPASFPKLEEIADTDFDVAVDFGGVCESGIEIGGTADEALRARVRDSINDALPSCAVTAELPDEPLGTADSMLLNRLGDDGVFVAQSYATRRAYWEPIAHGVAAAFDDEFEPTAMAGSCE
ncbi:poly-gamma-glutamate hydrolase family protein [Natronorubrum sp. DTA28]|uniref:poly-gamma-glutamate hydrolase family protein n=1 Tax=Natronorubrum sp. DTA28 TaxID=3447019 RepID=UPI003F86F83B